MLVSFDIKLVRRDKKQRGNGWACLRSGPWRFDCWVSFPPDFQPCYFCKSSYLFYFRFNFDFYVFNKMQL